MAQFSTFSQRSRSSSITGLILAGGEGRRMGGCDKGLVEWQGQAMAEHVAQRLRPQVNRILISCNRNQHRYGELADVAIADVRPGFMGPMAGMEAAIQHIDTPFVVITPCDTPSLPLDLVARLAQAQIASGDDICYAHDGQRDQYLCALLRRDVLHSIPDFLDGGDRAVRHWYALHKSGAVDFSDCPEQFRNHNKQD